MGSKHKKTAKELPADDPNGSLNLEEESPITRQEAIEHLLREIALVEKRADKFLHTLNTKSCYKAARVKDRSEAYDLYRCMRNELKMLQGLASCMEHTVRQL